MRKRCLSSVVTALSLIAQLDTFETALHIFDDAELTNTGLLIVVFILSLVLSCKVRTFSSYLQTFDEAICYSLFIGTSILTYMFIYKNKSIKNMIRLKYIIRSETLVLRISEGKDRYYKRVSHLLLGDPNLKYWDVTRERFTYRDTSYIENNNILEQFKNIYRNLRIEFPQLTVRQTASFYNRHGIISMNGTTRDR